MYLILKINSDLLNIHLIETICTSVCTCIDIFNVLLTEDVCCVNKVFLESQINLACKTDYQYPCLKYYQKYNMHMFSVIQMYL